MEFFSEDKLREISAQEARVKHHTILIVDDEEENLTNLHGLLEQDYIVVTAHNGQEALNLVQNETTPERIHLIISDQRMPELTGVEFLEKTTTLIPRTIRIILTAFADVNAIIEAINRGQIYKFILKPFDRDDMRLTVRRALEAYALDTQNVQLVEDLQQTNMALQDALGNLRVTKITHGVYWLQVPEANLYVLCGCPADVVKHMMQKGFIAETWKGEVSFETGPNAILLSDNLIQKGAFSNLAEFPVLQMFYRQGMMIPQHPNNKGLKPILIGTQQQVTAQMEYIYRGNYGLTSLEEIMAAGMPRTEAEAMMRIKMKFAFGKIHQTAELLDTCIVDKDPIEIRDGVFVRRVGFNHYEFQYKGKTASVDLNLGPQETYEAPYQLGFHQISREFFAVLHTGEGDGWDINRPCMASILMYQGDIYLIDAGPNILHVLRALGIDISEIKGIFHTHGHDDHFAGLPTLMQSDHRIKYYSTPLVRAAVAKKLSALMSMDEKLFYQYFDVCDLEFDTWNNLDGLEVKPLYSPHPVETNIFFFRALGEHGYRTYAHLADLTSFEVLDNMIEDDPTRPGLSKEWCDTIKTHYLIPVDLKKVDIGGGMIHGQVQDFVTDRSTKILLAHTALTLTPAQKEVGSEASFATMDVLIAKQQDYLRKHAANYLQTSFPELSIDQLRTLLNASVESINPGTIILGKGERPHLVYLILSGTVEYIQSELNINMTLSTGSFIGDVACLNDTVSAGTYRSVSHVQVLRLSDTIYRTFLESHKLLDQVMSIQRNIEFLRRTWLFGEGVSALAQNKIAQSMRGIRVEAHQRLPLEATPGLYLLDEGELHIHNAQQQTIETLHAGDFCGEQSVLAERPLEMSVQASMPSHVYVINPERLPVIPIVHWKLLEVSANRKSRLAFI